MSTLAKHLPALLLLAIAAGFVGSLAAIGAITGTDAVTVFLAVLAPVATVIGVKIGATSASTIPPSPPAAKVQ